jgi:nucleoside-triphosphatase
MSTSGLTTGLEEFFGIPRCTGWARRIAVGIKVVTAGRGEGKTSFVRAYVTHVAGLGSRVGGIASLAVFEGDHRVGYDLINLSTGERQPLARLADLEEGSTTVGVYQFDVAAVTVGNASIVEAVRSGADVVAIDEVGPLEFRGQGWAPALETVLIECRYDQELILVVRPSLADELPNRFPSPLWAGSVRVSPPWPDPSAE